LKEIIVKAAVKTVIFLLVLLAIATAVLNFAFPQHMATFFEQIGNYSLAVRYSSQRYDATGEIDDLARTYQNSVLYGRQDYIIKYGEKLIAFDGFESFCAEMDSLSQNGEFSEHATGYKLYVYGNLCKAYASVGEYDNALLRANESNGDESFLSGNAYITLVIYAAQANDEEFAGLIKEDLLLIRTNLTEGSQDITVLDDMLEILEGVGQATEEELPQS